MPKTSCTISGILLDIEGTTSSISFVHDEMFPFVLKHLEVFLADHLEEPQVMAACEQIAQDTGFSSTKDWCHSAPDTNLKELVVKEVRELMSRDAKATGLKALQGLIWQSGFESGELKAHVFSDVIPAIQDWRASGIDVRIYSSGSIGAQKLFFGHLREYGDCLKLFSGHYDTTIGGKKHPASYENIYRDWKLPAEEILFISDVPAELHAAQESGLQVVGSRRPGNPPVDEQGLSWITDFQEINERLNLASHRA